QLAGRVVVLGWFLGWFLRAHLRLRRTSTAAIAASGTIPIRLGAASVPTEQLHPPFPPDPPLPEDPPAPLDPPDPALPHAPNEFPFIVHAGCDVLGRPNCVANVGHIG